jgi:hypothetical protein
VGEPARMLSVFVTSAKDPPRRRCLESKKLLTRRRRLQQAVLRSSKVPQPLALVHRASLPAPGLLRASLVVPFQPSRRWGLEVVHWAASHLCWA